MMLLLHVDASFNTGGLVGSQGGIICGVTDKSSPEGCSVVSNGLEIVQNESDSTEPIGRRSTKPCLWLWALSSGQLFFCKSCIMDNLTCRALQRLCRRDLP